jgi:hypothetical protein
MSVNDLPSRRRSRAGRISDRPIAAPPLASKMAPSPANQVYAPPGWPVTSLPTNVSLKDLPTTDPHCTNDPCKAFMDGFAESERIAPLLSQLEYATWTVWFYSFWIFAFAVIHLCHIFRDHIPPRKRESQRHCSSWIHKLVALGPSITYRQLNGRFGEAIGLRQTSFRVLLLLAFSTIFFAILPFPQNVYLRSRFRFGSPPLSVRGAFIISFMPSGLTPYENYVLMLYHHANALTPLTVALAGKVNVITYLTGICYSKLNIFHRYCAYLLFCFSTIHTVSFSLTMERRKLTRLIGTSSDLPCPRWRMVNAKSALQR